MSEHLIVQAEENLIYIKTELRQEHNSLTFALGEQTSEEPRVHFKLLNESAEVSTVRQHVKQVFQITACCAGTLLLEEEIKCFDLKTCYGFVCAQQLSLHESLNKKSMCQKLCDAAMKFDKPVEGDTKDETQKTNAPCGKKTDFDLKESLVEETIPGDSTVWNHWTGN